MANYWLHLFLSETRESLSTSSLCVCVSNSEMKLSKTVVEHKDKTTRGLLRFLVEVFLSGQSKNTMDDNVV